MKAKWFWLWLSLGLVYYLLEALYRFCFKGGEAAHPLMIIVGGACCVVVGAINQIPRFYRAPVWRQALLGTAATLFIEFVAGCVLNLWLGLGIWDYAGLPGNVLGQICLPFSAIWFALMPAAIWLEDALQWIIYRWQQNIGKRARAGPPTITPYSLRSIYIDLITGR